MWWEIVAEIKWKMGLGGSFGGTKIMIFFPFPQDSFPLLEIGLILIINYKLNMQKVWIFGLHFKLSY